MRLMVAALAFSVWVIPTTQGQPEKGVIQSDRTTDADKAKISQQQKKSPADKTEERFLRIIKIQQERDAQERDAQERNANQNIAIQGKLVKYTRALVFVGILQAVVLIATVVVIYLQVETTRAVERAWVLAEIGKLPDSSVKPDTVAVLYIMPTFTNSGRTAARTKKIAIRHHQIPKTENLPLKMKCKEEIVELILPPGKGIQLSSGTLGITPQEYLRARQDEASLYVYGYVNYRDIGRKRRQTKFCFIYHASHGGDPTPDGFYPYLNAPPDYTKCT